MRVYVSETVYDDSGDTLSVTDVPDVPFLNCRNPLYVGVKESQVRRMIRSINREKLGGLSIGFWELCGNPSYVSKKGKINLDQFKTHDVIFFASPSRIHPKFKEKYSELIEAVKSRLC